MAQIIERRLGAEVFACTDGEVNIRQWDEYEREMIVSFHPDEIDMLISHLETVKQEAIRIREERIPLASQPIE